MKQLPFTFLSCCNVSVLNMRTHSFVRAFFRDELQVRQELAIPAPPLPTPERPDEPWRVEDFDAWWDAAWARLSTSARALPILHSTILPFPGGGQTSGASIPFTWGSRSLVAIAAGTRDLVVREPGHDAFSEAVAWWRSVGRHARDVPSLDAPLRDRGFAPKDLCTEAFPMDWFEALFDGMGFRLESAPFLEHFVRPIAQIRAGVAHMAGCRREKHLSFA